MVKLKRHRSPEYTSQIHSDTCSMVVKQALTEYSLEVHILQLNYSMQIIGSHTLYRPTVQQTTNNPDINSRYAIHKCSKHIQSNYKLDPFQTRFANSFSF